MRKLYIKTAEKMAETIRHYLMLASDDYEKRYSAYLTASDKIKENIKTEKGREAFEELTEKINEKLTHELLRTIFVMIDPKQEKPLFTLNTTYILRNGEIMDLRKNVSKELHNKPLLMEEFDNSHKRLTSFYFGKAEDYIMEFFKESYAYYC